MRLPESNSRGEKILMAFLAKGAMTIYQGAEAHGEFATRSFPDGISHEKMIELYCDLVERGCLYRDGVKYVLATRAGDTLRKKVAAPEAPRFIVPPRVRTFVASLNFFNSSAFTPRRIAL